MNKLTEANSKQEKKYYRDLEIVWSEFFKENKIYIDIDVADIQSSTSTSVGIKYRDTYAYYSTSLWLEFKRVEKMNIDKTPWELKKILFEDSDESGKLRYNMLRNAKRNTIRDLLKEYGKRRKSSQQMKDEKKELCDNYKVMSSTHTGLGAEVLSTRDIKINAYEDKFKVQPEMNLLGLKMSTNNIEAFLQRLEDIYLFDSLLSSNRLNGMNKRLLIDLVLLDKESIIEKEKISRGTLNKRIIRLKKRVKEIFSDLKLETAF
ncbi:hypothetical protein [Vagococcus fluvialis]|uniref:Uncharacterized protein n=1 Tax=Vagococcus fluvialis TaxID=2738 RepID=A0A7X6DAM8_9ENTE|nr:hypothetical protein [Vagococcus fluvialis]NKC68865.1 hypothetical protein [Vagococcus fluvialis]